MDYYQGYDDAMRQTRVTRSSGLLGLLIRVIISILYTGLIYVPLIIIAYSLSDLMSCLYSNDVYIKVGLTIIICYLIYASMYFLKGILIGLRLKEHPLWYGLFVLCIVLTSGIQFIGANAVLTNFFASRDVANYELWSWLGAGMVALLIYTHYQFLSNVAPRITFWSYHLGFDFAARKSGTKTTPKKSDRYFDNVMKVSFRKDVTQ